MDQHDVLIVGGGAAGLSAGLILARARRKVLICDAGRPRNRVSSSVGGYLTRDGIEPAQFQRHARLELQAYASVEIREKTEIVGARRSDAGFEVAQADGALAWGRKILLATGVTDVLPPLPGAKTFYGRGIWHCPYCNGYELRDRRIAVYGQTKAAVDLALELTGWTRQLVVVSDGAGSLSSSDRNRLARAGIAIRQERIAELAGRNGQLDRIVFAGSGSLSVDALFFRSDGVTDIALAQGLGITTGGKMIRTRGHGRTGVPGVFMAGDASRHVQFSIVAAGEGAAAAFAINSELLKEDIAATSGAPAGLPW